MRGAAVGWFSPSQVWMSLLHVVQQALPMWLSVQQVMKDNSMTRGLGGWASLSVGALL